MLLEETGRPNNVHFFLLPVALFTLKDFFGIVFFYFAVEKRDGPQLVALKYS